MRRLIGIYRIVGATLIAFSGAAAVGVLNGAARSALVQAEAAVALARYLRSQIECFMLPLTKALERCPREIYDALGYFAEQPPQSLRLLADNGYITDKDIKKILISLGDSLGLGYREQQISLCDHAIGLLETRRQTLAAQLPSKQRLNASLCLSGALAAVILFM